MAERKMAHDISSLAANVPQAMRERTQWLLYRMEQVEGEPKPRKVPYYASGRRRMGKQGSDEDRAALVTFDQALARLARPGFSGLGFAFLPGDGLIGIDVDRAIDPDTGEVAEHCREIISRCGSYTELSPSGTGVHVIVVGETETFKNNDVGVEVFSGRQFFTVTGRPWGEPRPVAELADDTLAWLRELVKGVAEVPASAHREQPAPSPTQRTAAAQTSDQAQRSASRYCLAALDSAAQRMRNAGEGRRNSTLNAEAYGLAQLVHTGGITESVIRAVLSDAARGAGLVDAEITPTLNSGVNGGLAHPRSLPERQQPERSAQVVPLRRPVVDVAVQHEEQMPEEPAWVAESSPPPSGLMAASAAPAAPKRGKGRKAGDDDGERDAEFWGRVDALSDRFRLIEATDTAWDGLELQIWRVPAMRMRFGSDVVKAWLARIATNMARSVRFTDLVFEPGEVVGEHQVNMFGGLKVKPVACTAADVEPMLALLRHLCAESAATPDEVDAVMHWVLCWQALPVQRVGTKMQTAVVMHGAQGTGKNLYWDLWRDLFGDYGVTVGQTEIEDKFNGWVSRKLAIIGDEVVSRQEMYHNKNRLKSIVTQQAKFAIRGMMQETRWESNHANVVFLSNESQPLALEERDRRYLVVYTPLEADPALYQAVRDFKAAGGLGKWLAYLQSYPLDGFDAHSKPVMTAAKSHLIELNWKPSERFAAEWTEGFLDLPVRVCSAEQLYRAFKRWADRNGERWPAAQAMFTKQVERFVRERVTRDERGRLREPALVYKQIGLKDQAANRKTVRCWLPTGTRPPAGVDEPSWAYQSVQAFEADLARFCRTPGMQDADE